MRTLDKIPVGGGGKILTVGGDGALRQHFLDMGLIPGSWVQVTKLAPMGDPVELTVHGYELTIRVADAALIEVDEKAKREESDGGLAACPAPDAGSGILKSRSRRKKGEKTAPAAAAQQTDADSLPYHEAHPGLGEPGKYHDSKNEHPLPKDTLLTFALVGNQNSGKTTLFNQLTGANQHVGNFPGVTVDRKDGVIRGHQNTMVTDLPGIYSMSPYTSEEIVTREFILKEKPKGIINIVDATNIERNLLLTMQLIELDVPMVIALNMMDEMRENGGTILVNVLEKELGVPVVPISAAKNEGIDELVDHLLHVAYYQEKPERLDFCGEDDYGGAVHRAIHAVMHLIEDHAQASGIPRRFAASKLIEGDHLVEEALGLDDHEKHEISELVEQMEHERGLDRSAAMADMRFSFITKLCAQTVRKPVESKEHYRSRQADKILTGKYTAIPCFVGIMVLIFYLTFNLIGPFLQDALQAGIDALAGLAERGMTAFGTNPVIISLVVDAVFGGIGTVVSFTPIIVLLFLFLSLLEDSGYMARVAFVMDKLLRKIGLSGRSIVPMLLGFGCSVPAIMATRTLPSKRDRRMTILMIPFMSCSAKILAYGFFTAEFFPRHGALVMTALYFIGILLGILVALVLKNTLFKGEAVPFVMELPNYRMPSLKSVGLLVWEKTKDFLSKAFTVIFLATIVIWFFRSFDVRLNYVTDASVSMLAYISKAITPIFKPLGYGDWRIVTGLITGLLAKENVVSVLSLLIGSPDVLATIISPAVAFALLVFILLYTPCVAAVSVIKREVGWKTTIYIVVFQIVFAWCASGAVRLIEMALHLG